MSQAAVQLYTVRDFTRTMDDLARTLEAIHAIGYEAVQISAVAALRDDHLASDAEVIRGLLDKNGLRCIATHRSWDRLTQFTDAEIALHQTLGCDFVAIGGAPREYDADGVAGYRRFLADSALTIARLKAAGIRFGHHNHQHEFRRDALSDIPSPWDVLIDEGGADYFLETDLYWAWEAGLDPADLQIRCTGRTPVIHLKDRGVDPATGKARMEAIGEGNMPWERLLLACRESGVEWYCVEQDICPRDPFDCLRSSFQYLHKRGI